MRPRILRRAVRTLVNQRLLAIKLGPLFEETEPHRAARTHANTKLNLVKQLTSPPYEEANARKKVREFGRAIGHLWALEQNEEARRKRKLKQMLRRATRTALEQVKVEPLDDVLKLAGVKK